MEKPCSLFDQPKAEREKERERERERERDSIFQHKQHVTTRHIYTTCTLLDTYQVKLTSGFAILFQWNIRILDFGLTVLRGAMPAGVAEAALNPIIMPGGGGIPPIPGIGGGGGTPGIPGNGGGGGTPGIPGNGGGGGTPGIPGNGGGGGTPGITIPGKGGAGGTPSSPTCPGWKRPGKIGGAGGTGLSSDIMESPPESSNIPC